MPEYHDTPGPADHGPEPDWLDAVLREATWAEIEPERVQSLRQRWAAINQRRTRRTRLLSTVAVVALIVSSAALHRVAVERAGRPAAARGEKPQAELPSDLGQPEPKSETPARANHPPLIASGQNADPPVDVPAARPRGRAYEQLILAAVRRRVAQRAGESSESPATRLEAAIDQIVEDPKADVAEVCRPLVDRRELVERQLAQIIHQSNGARRQASAVLLSHLASGRSLPLLAELRQWPATREAATTAMARLADPVTLARLAIGESRPELQRRLMAGLLQRNTEQSVRLFLNLVQHPAIGQRAIQSVQEVSDPPVEILIGYLSAPRTRHRLAAARVLGQLNDPEVSRQLIELVFHSQVGREALVALSSSQEPSAAQFVARAQLDLSLAATLRAARHRAASFAN
jgi:hypothetical protein